MQLANLMTIAVRKRHGSAERITMRLPAGGRGSIVANGGAVRGTSRQPFNSTRSGGVWSIATRDSRATFDARHTRTVNSGQASNDVINSAMRAYGFASLVRVFDAVAARNVLTRTANAALDSTRVLGGRSADALRVAPRALFAQNAIKNTTQIGRAAVLGAAYGC